MNQKSEMPSFGLETDPNAPKTTAQTSMAAGEKIEKKAGFFKSLFQSASKRLERGSTSLYRGVDPEDKGIENLSMKEIGTNMFNSVDNKVSDLGDKLEGGVNKLNEKFSTGLHNVVNPENKDMETMSIGEIGGNINMAASTKLYEMFDKDEKGLENMSFGEIFRNVKEFMIGKSEKKKQIAEERARIQAMAADLEAQPAKEKLPKLEDELANAMKGLWNWGRNAFVSAREYIRKTDVEANDAIIEAKLARMENGSAKDMIGKKKNQMAAFESKIENNEAVAA